MGPDRSNLRAARLPVACWQGTRPCPREATTQDPEGSARCLGQGSGRIIGEICLLGSREAGFGQKARAAGFRVSGVAFGESLTECLWLGIEQVLRATRATFGLVAVLDVSGDRVAVVDVESEVPSYGGLDWVIT